MAELRQLINRELHGTPLQRVAKLVYQSVIVIMLALVLISLHRLDQRAQAPARADSAVAETFTPHPSVYLGSQLITQLEGLRLDPYYDSSGFPTICYGHLLSTKRHVPLHHFRSRTYQECTELLESDLATVHQELDRVVLHPLNA
ncbi:MAG: hypothetical protein OXI59_17665, partial [Gemmatimonadota bacterium]|nr:hypothetical protein [Gemmatimonadota bacterium]